jgi:GTP-binding protein HflX
LKIFARHAQSTEARLQIELASIKHMDLILVWVWNFLVRSHRQHGSTASRGIGETNTEIMKRLTQAGDRIAENLAL